MGTLVTLTFEGTPGVDVTDANSGLDLVYPDADNGGSIKFADPTGIEFVSGAGGSYTIARGLTAAANPGVSFLGRFIAPATPAAPLCIAYLRRVGGDLRAASLIITDDGDLQIWDADGVLIGDGSIATLTEGSEYQVTLVANVTTGDIQARLYSAAGAQLGVERSGTGENLGEDDIDGFEIGVVSANAATSLIWLSVAVEDGRESEIPPHVPPPAPAATGFTVWDGMTEQTVTASVFDGSDEVEASAYLMPIGYANAASMVTQASTFYVAHRGGSGDWPEESMRAYTNSVAWGAGALELSCNRTSDGVWVGVHDADLTRTSPGAPSTPIANMTWAEVQQYTNSGEPYVRLEEVLDDYGSSHVIFLDPKYGGWDMDGFLGVILDHMPAENVVIKFFYTATDVANAAHARGLLTWGYYYQDSAASIPTTHGPWDILGMDYTADQNAWDLALATGKKVVAHIVPNSGAATTALGKGAHGLMVSGVTDVIDGPVVPI